MSDEASDMQVMCCLVEYAPPSDIPKTIERSMRLSTFKHLLDNAPVAFRLEGRRGI
jgi:hypothetical protein